MNGWCFTVCRLPWTKTLFALQSNASPQDFRQVHIMLHQSLGALDSCVPAARWKSCRCESELWVINLLQSMLWFTRTAWMKRTAVSMRWQNTVRAEAMKVWDLNPSSYSSVMPGTVTHTWEHTDVNVAHSKQKLESVMNCLSFITDQFATEAETTSLVEWVHQWTIDTINDCRAGLKPARCVTRLATPQVGM